MDGVRRFEISLLFILSLQKGVYTSLKSVLEVLSMKPKLSNFSTHELSWARSLLKRKLPGYFVDINALMSLSWEPNS